MKYRITKDEKGFRALVGKQSKFGTEFRYIEEDNTNLCRCVSYFDTQEKAIDACEKYHVAMGYDKLPKVIKEFEL